jgi:hypothetical protein
MTDTTPADDRMIRAPWTPEQVTALNAFQQRGGMHPFTCGGDHTPGSPALVAYTDGWRCPQPYGEACDYRQDWAHPFMFRAAATVPTPAPADRAAIRAAALREAADFVGNDDDCGCGGCDSCVPNKLAAELRRMADAVSGPGGVAGETQQPETQARRMMRSRFPSRPGTATVASDMCPRCKGDNSEAWALCARCAEQQPATQAPGTSPCTCADAGDCFAPAGHYADCPHHAPPAAVSQPDEEA